MTRKKRSQKKVKAAVRVTGRTVAYVQEVGKKGKLGKAKPVVLTTIRVQKAK